MTRKKFSVRVSDTIKKKNKNPFMICDKAFFKTVPDENSKNLQIENPFMQILQCLQKQLL